MALRLQIANFIIRLASYHHDEFKEGVSLTVFDELSRWEKYSYGCNELLFHPFHKWVYKGPFTPILWRLLWSNVKTTSKITVLGYVFTYYAMAAALPFCLINYFLTGWIPDLLDHYYLESFKIMILLLIVFNGIVSLPFLHDTSLALRVAIAHTSRFSLFSLTLFSQSPIAYNYMLHRLGKRNFFVGMWDTIKWMPLFMVFFGGISIQLAKSSMGHVLGINIEWTSTAKELEATGFFIGMDKIIKDFKYMYLIVILVTGALIYLAVFAPRGWVIYDFTIVLPVANQLVCHFMLPLSLGLF